MSLAEFLGHHPEQGHAWDGSGKCVFTVWAPEEKSVAVELNGQRPGSVRMEALGGGYWRAEVLGVPPGSLYRYRLESGRSRSDPASHLLLQDVHGPSAVVDHLSFDWRAHSLLRPPWPI